MDYSELPATFYRVSAKALIFDDQHQLLVFQDSHGKWELPGGGWEQGEDFDACLKRELMEEMRIVPTLIGPVKAVYRCQHESGYYKVCIAVSCEIETRDFVPAGDNLVEARFIGKQEFQTLNLQASEGGVLTCIDQIWPAR